MNLAELSKEYRLLSAQRTLINKDAAKLTLKMGGLEAQLRAALSSQGLTSANTPFGRPVMNTKVVGQAEDWALVNDWIHAERGAHILQRRINNDAVADLNDMGIEIPGMKIVELEKVSVLAPT